jgi:serine/threonine-protein phosphatase 2A activator
MSSPYLWDISGAESWLKVAKGLIKMYQKEVLGRLVVIKHLKFGKLFSFE